MDAMMKFPELDRNRRAHLRRYDRNVARPTLWADEKNDLDIVGEVVKGKIVRRLVRNYGVGVAEVARQLEISTPGSS